VRIGYVLDDRLDSDNGVQQSVRVLGKWLQDEGHQVIAFCGGPADAAPTFSLPGFDKVWTLATNQRVRFNGNRIETPTRPRRISHEIKREISQCDVLHVQAPYGPLVSHRVIRNAGLDTKVVASFHMAPTYWHVKFAGRLSCVLMRQSASRIDRIACDSPASASLMWSMWRRHPDAIIGHPLDPQRFSVPISPSLSTSSPEGARPFRIVFVGRLVERKGCRYLLRAIARIPESVRANNFEVLMIGDGPLASSLEQLTRELHLESVVSFFGHVPERRKVELLGSADLAVFPAVGGESFGIVLLEAMGCGTPVLAFSNDGYGYVLRNVPHSLVAVKDDASLARRITGLIEDPVALRKLKASQMVASHEYMVSNIGSRYLELYAR
jgi:phosphatidyl-myo-inositol alpha-mannosyltransferase